MTDVLGWRRKFGVLGPSTNTIVQPDFEMMRPITSVPAMNVSLLTACALGGKMRL